MKEKQNNEGFTMMTTDTKEVATQIKNKELVSRVAALAGVELD